MFGLSILSTKLIIAGIAVAAIGTIIFLGYTHYTGLVADNAILQANAKVLKTAVGIQSETIDVQTRVLKDWQEAQEDLLENIERMQEVAVSATMQMRLFNDLFAKHDLEKLAHAKPVLLERRLNSGTANILRLLECASGADGADCDAGNSDTP